MSDVLEHRECAEALGAYALGALPDLENERLRRHLASCRPCRADLEGLRAAVDALPASVPQIDPPPELKVRLMAIVEAEAEVLSAAGEAADRPAPARQPRRRRRLPVSISSVGLAAACACILAVAVVVGVAGSGPAPTTRVIHAQLSGPLLASGSRATLELTGTRARLLVSALPAPAADHIDELWVKHGAASPRAAGAFVVSSGSVDVAGPVQKGDLVMVTVEPGRGSRAPTTPPAIVARA